MRLRFASLFVLLPALLAACPRPEGRPEVRRLGPEADALLDGPEKEGAIVSAWVADARTGAPLYARHERTRLIPASTLKVVTTSTALARLGPDFRFQTPVVAHGSLTGDVFEGDLFATAQGDPSLGSWRFPSTDATAVCDQVARGLLNLGVRRFRGRIGVQNGQAPDDAALGPGWSWDDAGYDYSATPRRFVFRESVVDLVLSRPASSLCEPTAVRVRFEPAQETLWANVVLADAPRESLDCTRASGSRRVRCAWLHPAGTCPLEGRTRVTTDDPEGLFSSCVADALVRQGIERLPSGAGAAFAPNAAPKDFAVTTLVSPPLTELVRVTNKESLNLYAERLALLLGRDATGIESYASTRKALLDELVTRGVSPSELNLADGSGLSRYNLVTAHALATALQASLEKPWAGALLESLPVAGVDGTLAQHALPESVRGKVRAKTGSMSGQRAFVGVAERPWDTEHPRVVFALMFGNVVAPALPPNTVFDRFAEMLVLDEVR